MAQKITSVLLFLLFYICIAFTQSNLHVDHIGSEDGLTSQLCQLLTEDKFGNLWISTFKDVQKYDGYSVTVFPLKKAEKDIVAFTDLTADRNGNIWVIRGTPTYVEHEKYFTESFDYNISIIDQQIDKEVSFANYVNSNELSQEEIKKIQEFEGELFFITRSNKIFSYADSISLYSDYPDKEAYIMLNAQKQIVSISQNSIRINNKNGIEIHEIDSTKISNCSHLNISNKGAVYFGSSSNDSILISQFTSGNWHDLITIPKEEFSVYYLSELKVDQVQNKYLLVNGNLYPYLNNSYSTERINIESRPIYETLLSKTNLLFVATNLGIYVYDSKKKLFGNIFTTYPNQNSVRGFFTNDRITAYSKNYKEIIISNYEDYDLSFLKGSQYYNLAYQYYQDPSDEDVLWVCGQFPERFKKIDFGSSKVTNNYKQSSNNGIYNHIHKSSKSSNIYLTGDRGLFYLNESNDSIENIKLNCIGSQSYKANHLVERNGKFWIASSIGVISYDEQNKDCEIYPIISDSANFSIQYIHSDNTDPDILWLGTNREGLVKWNTKLNTFNIYNTSNGMSNNDIHAIIEDSKERLWISTNKYLNCLDKKTNDILIFTEQDGLTHSEFNKYSFFFDSLKNTIYFGGLNGYNFFNPDSIDTKKSENEIKLNLIDIIKTKTDLTIESIVDQVRSTRTIEFEESDVSIQLELSTNHLSNNDKVNYSFRIPGIYDEWNTQTSNLLNISRLPYGSYTLEIISDLYKPSFTSKILSLDVSVIKPFKKTWKALFLAICAILFTIWLSVKKYIQNINKRNIRLQKLISERTSELQESNKTKNKLFAILAHDLRNPISSLTDMSEKIKFLANRNRVNELELLAEQTKSKISALDNNLNNILMWAMSENDMLSEVPEKLSLLIEIQKIINLYSHEVDRKRLNITIDLIDVDQVFLGVNALQTILRNYIGNAIKFSYKNGSIHFSKTHQNDNRIELKIADTGIGLQSEKVKDSEIKNKIRESGKGLGLGMKIAEELSVKYGVGIKITNNKDSGISVFLDMPKK